MNIDFDTIISGIEYTPSISQGKYEIAPGIWAKLKRPTVALRREVFLRAEELNATSDEQADYKLAHMITEMEGGKPWPAFDETIPEVVSQSVKDFFLSLRLILERQLQSFEASSPSAPPEQSKQAGSEAGSPIETA